MSAVPDRLVGALADRYRIERELGAGGMATVYLAEDLKHKRKIALKVLKPELAAVLGAERFVVEITTTAALQHPHILPLFDSGTAGGFLYYVMPFIEGETLRGKLDRETQFGIDEAVRIATDVADALEYAHQHGVIHRDIKPENILLANGRPMVADFGIALAVSAAAGGRMTETGLSLGTPHYMSPEQATAEKEITARSDVYSLGSVLYEMLAGQPPHLGGSAQQIIMKIIAEPVAVVTTLRKSVPANVAAAVAKSLEKLPADRFASAKEFAGALANPAYTGAMISGGPASFRGRSRIVPRLATFAIGAALIAIAAWGWLRPAGGTSADVTRLAIAFPKGEEYFDDFDASFVVAPDGRSFVYSVLDTGTTAGTYRLWIRRLDQLHGSPIPGTEGAGTPMFSPDGRSLAFNAGTPRGDLMVVPLSGGPATTLLQENPTPSGGTWGNDGFIYVVSARGLGRVRETGGGVEDVATPDRTHGEHGFTRPELLTGGKVLLFVAESGEGSVVMAMRLGSREMRTVGRGNVAKGLPGGFVAIGQNDGTVIVSRFDQDRLALTGPAKTVLQGVKTRRFNNGLAVAVSASGTLLYGVTGERRATPVWVDRVGGALDVEAGWRGDFRNPALSPDGTRLAFARWTAAGEDIWIKRIGGPLTRLTLDGDGNVRPVWSPDGRTLLFAHSNGNLFLQAADGRAAAARLPTGAGEAWEGIWITGGRELLFRGGGGSGAGRDLFRLPLAPDSTPIPLLASPSEELSPALSPDGHWLAYVGDESGRFEIYLRPFPNVDSAKWQVSTDGGSEPLWAHNGLELFYRSDTHKLVATQIRPSAKEPVGPRQVLFDDSPYAVERIHVDYAVSLDDRRFLMIREDRSVDQRLVLVMNWVADVRSQLGASR